MNKITIGIDPDSNEHGIAVYECGRLIRLVCLPLIGLYEMFDEDVSLIADGLFEIHIEDVCANNAVFRTGNNIKVQQSIARRLGMVQQSQVEIERLAAHFGIIVVKHKISKMWKKDKAQFEKITGWTGRSNEDTRSAAYFGYLGLK